MSSHIELCGIALTLWSQEAASWAQAFFSVLAILITYRLASRSSREEVARRQTEQQQRAKALSLALLPAVTEWLSRLQRLTSNECQEWIDVMNDGTLKKRSVVPEKIIASIENLHLLEDIGHSIEVAVFLQVWLVDNQASALASSRGDSGDSTEDENIWRTYLARVDRLYAEIRSAKNSIWLRFEEELS